HVSGVPALQRAEPGLHAPVQSPPEQPTEHVLSKSHAVPVELNTSTTCPVQRAAAGVHATNSVHPAVSDAHDWAHACKACHCDAALHSWRTVPLHWTPPSGQAPEPPEQPPSPLV